MKIKKGTVYTIVIGLVIIFMAFSLYKVEGEKEDMQAKHVITIGERDSALVELDSVNKELLEKNNILDSINKTLIDKELDIKNLNEQIEYLKKTSSFLTDLPKNKDIKKIKFEDNK